MKTGWMEADTMIIAGTTADGERVGRVFGGRGKDKRGKLSEIAKGTARALGGLIDDGIDANAFVDMLEDELQVCLMQKFERGDR